MEEVSEKTIADGYPRPSSLSRKSKKVARTPSIAKGVPQIKSREEFPEPPIAEDGDLQSLPPVSGPTAGVSDGYDLDLLRLFTVS